MWCVVVYLIVFAAASLPLACGYIMAGGDILIWLARIEEVAENLQAGKLLLFPSAELTVAQGAQFSALNSNLWLVVPALIRIMGGSVTLAYRLYILLLNGIALVSAKKMFEEIVDSRRAVLLGVLLYMTSPYRVYVCYDKANLGMMAGWALIPLVLWGMMKCISKCENWKAVLITAAAYALVGYADAILWILTTGILLLGMLWYRKIKIVLPMALGGIFFVSGGIYSLRYLLKGGMEVWGFDLGSIASKGYTIGQLFSSWTYAADCPGLGLGLLIGLFFLLWLGFVEKETFIQKKNGFFAGILCLMLFASLTYFPWDVIQRLGMPFLRLVSIFETPGICFGFAVLAASILSAYAVQGAEKQTGLFVKVGIPLMMALAALGIGIYLCNTLTYNRLPMFL